MNRATAATIAVGLIAGSTLAGRAQGAELSAAEIVARNEAARGGLDAWRKVATMAWTGHIESTRAPGGVQFKLEQKRPNKTRLQIQADGEKSVRIFDGAQGWKVRMARGQPQVNPYTPQESMFARAGHGIDGPLIDSAAKGNLATLEGTEEIGGRKTYHLSMRLAKGGHEDVWVDAETFLEIRYDRLADGPAGKPRRVSITYGDYRTVEGLQVPFLIKTGGGAGSMPDKMKIETVLLNTPLDDAAFTMPAAPRQRNRARQAF